MVLGNKTDKTEKGYCDKRIEGSDASSQARENSYGSRNTFVTSTGHIVNRN